ncbi:MAG: hypothetical protein WD960_02580 [Gemmatimonadota bacterium]
MKRWLGLLAALTFLFPLIPAQAEAQVSFGPQVVLWDFEELGVGARVEFGLADAIGIEDGFFESLYGSVNTSYLFIDGDGTNLVFNVNGNVPIAMDGGLRPYVGAGLNHFRSSISVGGTSFSSSASGLNLLGGLLLDLGEIPAFGELQFSTTGDGFLSLTGGVLFGG